jgi:coenzyme A diphosphatase NUDT7
MTHFITMCSTNHSFDRAIMVRVASIGYAQEPLFELRAPSQPTMSERIAWVFAHDHAFRKAAEEEGIDVEECLRKSRRMMKQKEKVMGRKLVKL